MNSESSQVIAQDFAACHPAAAKTQSVFRIQSHHPLVQQRWSFAKISRLMAELLRAASLRALLAHIDAGFQIGIVQVFARFRTAVTNISANPTDTRGQGRIARSESRTDVAHIDTIH